MNEHILRQEIERLIRMNIVCIDKEFIEELKIPDEYTVGEEWLATRILKLIKDHLEIEKKGQKAND